MTQKEILTAVEKIVAAQGGQGIFLLRGALASGKTTLVQKFCARQGVGVAVTSPTFNIVQEYGGKIFHYDLYRKGVQDLWALGLAEHLAREGVHFVEWGGAEWEKILRGLGWRVAVVAITMRGRRRVYELANG